MADEHADDFEALIPHEDVVVSLVVPCIADKHHVPESALHRLQKYINIYACRKKSFRYVLWRVKTGPVT